MDIEKLEFRMHWSMTSCEYTETWMLCHILDDYLCRLPAETESLLRQAQKGTVIDLPSESDDIGVKAECLGTFGREEEYPTCSECDVDIDWDVAGWD